MTDGIGGWWRGLFMPIEQSIMESNPIISWTGNLASLAAIIGAFAGWVPVLAALIALVWYTVQIFESRTFQRWRRTRHVRRLLKAKAMVLTMEGVLGHDEAIDKEFWHVTRDKSQKILYEIEQQIAKN